MLEVGIADVSVSALIDESDVEVESESKSIKNKYSKLILRHFMIKIIRYCKLHHLIVIPVVDGIDVVIDEVSSVVDATFDIFVEGVKFIVVVEMFDNVIVVVQ